MAIRPLRFAYQNPLHRSSFHFRCRYFAALCFAFEASSSAASISVIACTYCIHLPFDWSDLTNNLVALPNLARYSAARIAKDSLVDLAHHSPQQFAAAFTSSLPTRSQTLPGSYSFISFNCY